MNSKILVVAATFEELAETFAFFDLQKIPFISCAAFDILITGVGSTATAFALGKHLTKEYNLLLNVGIAGSFDRDIALGSLVNITEDTFSELGAENGDQFIPIEELGFGKSKFTSEFAMAQDLFKPLLTVSGITVNTVHGNSARIAEVLARLQVKTESMEGAAVFYAAELMNIPAVQIRSISNYVEQRDKSNWQIGLAVKNLNTWLISFLKNIALFNHLNTK